MIARIQIPKGWRRLKPGSKLVRGDMYLNDEVRPMEWLHFVGPDLKRTFPALFCIRRVKRKRAKAERFPGFVEARPEDRSTWKEFDGFSDMGSGPMMTFQDWLFSPLGPGGTRFWLRRGAR